MTHLLYSPSAPPPSPRHPPPTAHSPPCQCTQSSAHTNPPALHIWRTKTTLPPCAALRAPISRPKWAIHAPHAPHHTLHPCTPRHLPIGQGWDPRISTSPTATPASSPTCRWQGRCWCPRDSIALDLDWSSSSHQVPRTSRLTASSIDSAWSINPARQDSIPGRFFLDRPRSADRPSGDSTHIIATGSVRGYKRWAGSAEHWRRPPPSMAAVGAPQRLQNAWACMETSV
jgi:hypothetical protein